LVLARGTLHSGYTGNRAANRDDVESVERAFHQGFFNPALRQAAESLESDDDKLICYTHLGNSLVLPQTKCKRELVQAVLEVYTHERLSWMIHAYDHKVG
jgi:hypothetical protein